MNRNQKIALGCGGAGCLGLIVVAIVGGLIYFFAVRPAAYRASRNYNYNFNVNDNYNSNYNSNSNSNSDSADDSNDNSSSSTSSLSDDDKHKLFHAATMTGDTELITRVNVKLGLWKDNHTPGDDYQQFATEHAIWVFQNMDWVRSINTTEKAKAYVEEHLP